MSFLDICELSVEGIPAVRLENEWLIVVVLVGKGADVWELIYKPLGIDLLMKTKSGLEPLHGRDLRSKPLTHYAKPYPGGWQELLPNRALFGGREIGHDREGESACVPWEFELRRNVAGEIAVRCRVALTESPLIVVKEFRLRAGKPELFVEEEVEGVGGWPVQFIWTQHPAFGEPLVDGSARISLPPGSRVFQALWYDAAPDSRALLSSFEEEVGKITLDNGRIKDLREAEQRRMDGDNCFVSLFGFEEAEVGIDNPRLGIRLRLMWDKETWPHLRYWSSNNEEMYTVALEPSNSRFSDIHDSLKHGEALTLHPGEKCSAWMRLRVERL
ncbi:DUF4432 family protein [Paenibacillus cellulositrophicus]|uniref:DUF4432 family protein n=1 Tax=Paenibacillus cellulositrophicus TaxID=562959 RepID=UPI0012678236|nr:DUF4432 family protein [Paenibacillus cellulositrophicus]